MGQMTAVIPDSIGTVCCAIYPSPSPFITQQIDSQMFEEEGLIVCISYFYTYSLFSLKVSMRQTVVQEDVAAQHS
jgi:hypothetical protein